VVVTTQYLPRDMMLRYTECSSTAEWGRMLNAGGPGIGFGRGGGGFYSLPAGAQAARRLKPHDNLKSSKHGMGWVLR
jgi:hypothetical protein